MLVQYVRCVQASFSSAVEVCVNEMADGEAGQGRARRGEVQIVLSYKAKIDLRERSGTPGTQSWVGVPFRYVEECGGSSTPKLSDLD